MATSTLSDLDRISRTVFRPLRRFAIATCTSCAWVLFDLQALSFLSYLKPWSTDTMRRTHKQSHLRGCHRTARIHGKGDTITRPVCSFIHFQHLSASDPSSPGLADHLRNPRYLFCQFTTGRNVNAGGMWPALPQASTFPLGPSSNRPFF